MLLLGIITFIIANTLCSFTVNAFHYTRLAVIIIIMSGLLTIENINNGVEEISIYCSLVFQSNRTLFMELLLFIVGSLCLITFHGQSAFRGHNKNQRGSGIISSSDEGKTTATGGFNGVLQNKSEYEYSGRAMTAFIRKRDGSPNTIPKEYSLVVIFSVIGASLILSSYNLISIYLATELQSFALYILAALSRDSLRSVQASLKYFLLGA